MGKKFENFVRTEVFPFLLPFGFEKIGRWWHKGEEIDIVAVNGKRIMPIQKPVAPRSSAMVGNIGDSL